MINLERFKPLALGGMGKSPNYSSQEYWEEIAKIDKINQMTNNLKRAREFVHFLPREVIIESKKYYDSGEEDCFKSLLEFLQAEYNKRYPRKILKVQIKIKRPETKTQAVESKSSERIIEVRREKESNWYEEFIKDRPIAKELIQKIVERGKESRKHGGSRWNKSFNHEEIGNNPIKIAACLKAWEEYFGSLDVGDVVIAIDECRDEDVESFKRKLYKGKFGAGIKPEDVRIKEYNNKIEKYRDDFEEFMKKVKDYSEKVKERERWREEKEMERGDDYG